MPTLAFQEPHVVTPHYSAWILKFNSAGFEDGAAVAADRRSDVIGLAGFRAVYMGASSNIVPRVDAGDGELNRLDFQMKVPFALYTPGEEETPDNFRYAGNNLNPNYSAALPYKMSLIAGATNPVETLNALFVPPNMGGLGNAGYIGGACPPFLFIDISDDCLPDPANPASDAPNRGTVWMWAIK